MIKKKNIFKFNASIAAGNSEGTIWDVTVVQAGFAPARPHLFIAKEALTSSQNVFDGARVYVNEDADFFGHKIDSSKKGIKEVVGFLKNGYVQGDELRYEFHILPSAQWLKDNLLVLRAENQLDVFQLSIDGGYYSEGTRFVSEANETVPIVTGFAGGDVDIVPRGAAGGKFNRLVASHSQSQGDTLMELRLKLMALFALAYPVIFASKNIDWLKVNENELYSHLLAADKPQDRLHLPEGWDAQTIGSTLDTKINELKAAVHKDEPTPPVPPTPPQQDKAIKAALDAQQAEIKQLRLIACASQLSSALTESKLPDVVQKEVRKLYEGKVFAAAELNDTINSFRQIAAHFTNPEVNNHGMDIHAGPESIDKLQAGLELMFACNGSAIKPLKAGSDEYNKIAKVGNGNVSPIRSIKEAYIMATGDVNVTGLKKESKRLLFSLETTDWANILANTLNRQLVKDYNMLALDTWRVFTDVTSPKDFRPQTRVRYGGYGNLPAVAEGGPYLGLSSPTDETMNYSPSKRGGTEDVTLEMIKNDDVGAIVKIPTRMARAAGQTLHEFVYDFVKPSYTGLIYDGSVLYVAGHSNVGASALDSTYLTAARLRMLKQAQGDNSKRLGIVAGYLLVPPDLEKTGYELTTNAFGKSNMVPEFYQQLGITPIRVDYWTDANDWALVASRNSGVGIEIGFLDGQEVPELLVSDIPNVGSWFTNDKTTYKIRHIYGGGITDYRFFDGSVV
jgi:hypothetical protein